MPAASADSTAIGSRPEERHDSRSLNHCRAGLGSGHQHESRRTIAALAAVGFDGVISSCVFGWEEDARGVSEREREKALALVGKHFGGDKETAVTSSKIKKQETSP